MPELPEVETTVRDLDKLIVGKTITGVWTSYNSPYHYGKNQIKDPAYFRKFKTAIINKKIINVTRRAKNVLIHLENNKTILIHMKMTGHLLYGEYLKKTPKQIQKDNVEWVPKLKTGPLTDKFNGWLRLVFTLSNNSQKAKHLALSDLRKFAKVTLINTDDLENSPEISHIGPEILNNFTAVDFIKRIQKYPKKTIKQTLLDQTVIAGIGNIYSDESLWLAKIHPAKLVKQLNEEKLKILFKEIKKVLKKSINLRGDSMSDYRTPYGTKGGFQNKHNVYQRKNQNCNLRGCSGIIERIVVAGRGTHFCSKCQK